MDTLSEDLLTGQARGEADHGSILTRLAHLSGPDTLTGDTPACQYMYRQLCV
jgi:hypothetical protein